MALSIGRIAHAGLVVETAHVRGLMDPLFMNVVAGLALEPPIRVNRRRLAREKFDFIIISHHHLDHLCPDSLHLLDRKLPVVFPKGADLLQGVLRMLGFRNFIPVEYWKPIQIGDLTMTATPSVKDFPEMGMIFQSGRYSCWNTVDSAINDSRIRKARQVAGSIDLMFCYYQLMNEWSICRNALGGDFPYDLHDKHLRNVAKTAPRAFVPGSCGVKDAIGKWRDYREYLMTEPQFIEDMRKFRPNIRGIRLAPGDRVDLHRGFAVKKNALGFVRPAGHRYARYEWRPDLGVPPLEDLNPLGHGKKALRAAVHGYLRGDFLSGLREPRLREMVVPRLLALWRREKMVWRLEVVYPDRTSETWCMDFGERLLRWKNPEPEIFPKMHTTVAASLIPDLLSGDTNPFVATRMRRLCTRQYTASPAGIRSWESKSEANGVEWDPLFNLLLYGNTERWFLKRAMALTDVGP